MWPSRDKANTDRYRQLITSITWFGISREHQLSCLFLVEWFLSYTDIIYIFKLFIIICSTITVIIFRLFFNPLWDYFSLISVLFLFAIWLPNNVTIHSWYMISYELDMLFRPSVRFIFSPETCFSSNTSDIKSSTFVQSSLNNWKSTFSHSVNLNIF